MQISERTEKEIYDFGKLAKKSKLNILYFADSLGSMNEKYIKNIVNILRKNWKGELGIHTHTI